MLGWSTEKENGEIIDFYDEGYEASKGTTLYAQWEKKPVAFLLTLYYR